LQSDMEEDPWALFGDDEAAPAERQPASSHPHLAWVKTLWSRVTPLPEVESCGRSLQQDLQRRSHDLFHDLKISGSAYATEAIGCLREIQGGDPEEAGRAAAQCQEFCTAEMEDKSQWTSAWRLTASFSLGQQICSCLLGSTPDSSAVAKLWMRLFEILVYAGQDIGVEHELTGTWVAGVILHAELHVARGAGTVGVPAVDLEIPRTLPAAAVAHVPVVDHAKAIPRVHCDSLPVLQFAEQYLGKEGKPGSPVIIEGYLDSNWDLEKLSDLGQLLNASGHHLVPVTFGSSLVGTDFETTVVPLRSLIVEHLATSNATHGAGENSESNAGDTARLPDPDLERILPRTCYMSQHQLFHQCPELLDYITVPEYTMGRRLSPLNAWVGTRGTVTTLHSDAGENLLCQVAGFKYVRLYALDQTDRLHVRYVREGTPNVWGTSPVRVEKPDLDAHSQFADATYQETLLKPGDMLYIPKHHWHYIRSLTTSISVNFW